MYISSLVPKVNLDTVSSSYRKVILSQGLCSNLQVQCCICKVTCFLQVTFLFSFFFPFHLFFFFHFPERYLR